MTHLIPLKQARVSTGRATQPAIWPTGIRGEGGSQRGGERALALARSSISHHHCSRAKHGRYKQIRLSWRGGVTLHCGERRRTLTPALSRSTGRGVKGRVAINMSYTLARPGQEPR